MSNRVSEDNATRRETVNRELKNCTEVTLHALFYDNVQRLVRACAARVIVNSVKTTRVSIHVNRGRPVPSVTCP